MVAQPVKLGRPTHEHRARVEARRQLGALPDHRNRQIRILGEDRALQLAEALTRLMPSWSTSVCLASWYAWSASAWRSQRYRASISCAWRRSR